MEAVFILSFVFGIIALKFFLLFLPMVIWYWIAKSKRKRKVKRWKATDEEKFNQDFMEDYHQFLSDVALWRGFRMIRR